MGEITAPNTQETGPSEKVLQTTAARLLKERDHAEAELARVAAECDKLRKQINDGVLPAELASELRSIFSHVPGLGMAFNRNLRTVSEAAKTIESMSVIMQELFDRVRDLEKQRDATDSMLAGAGELFLRMTEAAQEDRARRQRQQGDHH